MPTKRPLRPEATPLYYAILCRLRWLIDHLIATYPGDIDVRGGYYKTAWIAALDIGEIDVACSLLRSGLIQMPWIAEGENPLHRASEGGRADIVRLLLEHNTDIDILTGTSQTTSLALASAIGPSEISRLLIQAGAEVNTRNWEGWTPLNMASDNGHLDVVRLLLDHGADVDSPNNKGRAPLHSAVNNGRFDT